MKRREREKGNLFEAVAKGLIFIRVSVFFFVIPEWLICVSGNDLYNVKGTSGELDQERRSYGYYELTKNFFYMLSLEL